MNNLRVLVTGGAGFIGSNIVEYLLLNNVKFVRVLDNLITGKQENVDLFQKYKNYEFFLGDITDLDTCRRAMVGIDVICHQAALGSVPRSIDNPLASHNTNVNGFFNILLSAKEAGIKRVVFASSSSVYGDNKELPKKEERIGRELSPYAVTKHVDELYGYIFTKTYGLECIGLRYFNVFGPRQDPNGAYAAVIPKFINLMMNNEQPIVNGDGSFSRDFTYVSNVVQANILALTVKNPVCFGECFNIGMNANSTINTLIQTINSILDKSIQPIYGSVRSGDVPHSHADISKAMRFLKYNPQVKFEEGVILTVKYMIEESQNKKKVKKPLSTENLLIYYDPLFRKNNSILELIQSVSNFYNTQICVICQNDKQIPYNRVFYIQYQNDLITTFQSCFDSFTENFLKIRMYVETNNKTQDIHNFEQTWKTDFKIFYRSNKLTLNQSEINPPLIKPSMKSTKLNNNIKIMMFINKKDIIPNINQNIIIKEIEDNELITDMLTDVHIVIVPLNSTVTIEAINNECLILFKKGDMFSNIIIENQIGLQYNNLNDLKTKVIEIQQIYKNHTFNKEKIKEILKRWSITSFFNKILI